MIARADPTSSGDVELWELHEELLREVRPKVTQDGQFWLIHMLFLPVLMCPLVLLCKGLFAQVFY